jgi:hypothetical protein
MIFSVLVLIFVLGITYFHWIQGLFSGVISMVLAVIAGTLALGMHEWVVASLLGGRLADYANAMVLCGLFALIYGGGRFLFDSFVPGNVRVPLYVDKVGGAVCGFVVGVFAVGTFAVAAQSMPLGPTVAYFTRYPIAENKQVVVPGERRSQDAEVSGSLEEDFPDPDKEASLMIAADSMLVDFVKFQSEGGAMSGNTSFTAHHPDLLRGLFFQRLGIEPGAKHSALNIGGKNDIAVGGVYAPAQLAQIDGELSAIRQRKLPAQLKSDTNKVVLVVRTIAKRSAAESDGIFRFSPGQIRLVTNGNVYYPVGTLYHPGSLLLANRIDDYLAADQDADQSTIDLVFHVDRADILADGTAKDGLKIKPGAFVEVKRYARVDLSDRDVANTVPTGVISGTVLRKKSLLEDINKRVAEGMIGN